MPSRSRPPAGPIPGIEDLIEIRHRAHTVGLASRHQVNSLLSGLYASVFRGQGMDFEESREYRVGDEIRNMDWRVTARTGTPHLKVFREERERPVMLCVDAGPHMRFGTRGTFKSVQAARAAALLGWSATGNQDRVGALLFGDPVQGPGYYRPSRGRRALWQMLRGLTRMGTEEATGEQGPGPGADALLEALDRLQRSVSTGALVFLIADLNRDPEGLESRLGRLRERHEVVLVPVDDPADRELPAIGRVVFTTHDGQEVEVDTDDPRGRAHYQAQWQARREQLGAVARRLGIDLIPVRTDAEVHRSMLEGLRLRARRLGMR